MTVSISTKTVKKINSQTRPPQQPHASSGRSVVTERTGGRGYNSARTSGNRGNYRGGRSVTINGRGQGDKFDSDENDFE